MKRGLALFFFTGLIAAWPVVGQGRPPAAEIGGRSTQPDWIKQGVVAASSMESLSFILRRGGQPEAADREWLEDRSEAAMRRFKKNGINLLVLTLHKGAGLKAESRDIEATRNGNQAAWTPDGRLVSKIRSYKAIRTAGNSLLAWQEFQRHQGSAELRAVEALAFGDRNLGVVAGSDTGQPVSRPSMQPIVDFFWSRAKALTDTVEAADVAVLRSFASVEFNPSQAHVSTTLFEQSLIQARIPFAVIFDRQMTDLGRYKVLVLANQNALSDAQIEQIRAFVRDGGGLVATQESPLLTEWRTRREKFALSDLFGFDKPVARPARRTWGKGRVAYIPRVEPSVTPPPPQMNYYFGNQYWKLPRNHEEMIASVRWAAGDRLSLDVQAPPAVAIELARQPGTDTALLHMVNYDSARPMENIRVGYRIPAGFRLRDVSIDEPGSKAPEPVQVTVQDGMASLTIPRLSLYKLVLFRLAR